MSNGPNTTPINSVETLLDDPRRHHGRYSPTHGCWIPFVPPQEAAPGQTQNNDTTQNSKEALQGISTTWFSKTGEANLVSKEEDAHLWAAPTRVAKDPMTYRQVWAYKEEQSRWIQLWVSLEGLWYDEEPTWLEEEYQAGQEKYQKALRELLTRTVFATAKTTTTTR